MAFFEKDYIRFFKELAKNNNKEWFDQNRKRYEKSVKKPFTEFTAEMILRMHELDPEIKIEPKDAMFRINRDIRFSKDKTPYKIHMSAIVSSGGKKNKSKPGMYFQLGAEDVRIYSGAHMLEKEDLYHVRMEVAKNPKEFEKLINNKKFKDRFGGIHGEKNKRIEKELTEAAEKQPLIYNKSFYYFAKFKPDVMLKDDFADLLMDYYKTAKPLGDFFARAMN